MDSVSASPPDPADVAAAGVVVFPRSPLDLRTTTQCPACLQPLRSVVCTSCGLDLRHPAAADLAAVSASIADALDTRLGLIGRIRRETRGSAAPAPPQPSPVVVPWQAPTPASEPSPARHGRSGIQIALIVIGISLLSVFAVFGVVYAFVAYGMGVRTLIIGAATLATIVAATVVARRGLSSTAEGLAALGSVVLVLDAWAVRQTDAFGLGGTDSVTYWGWALTSVAVVAGTWAWLGRHRSPLLLATIAAPIGAALIAVEATSALVSGADAVIASLTASAVAVVVAVLGARALAETHSAVVRVAVSVISTAVVPLTALPLLVGISQLVNEGWWWAVAAGVAHLAIAIGAILVIGSMPTTSPDRTNSPYGAVVAALATLSMVVALALAAESVRDDHVLLAVALLAPVSLALCADVAAPRMRRRVSALPVYSAAIAAAVAAGLVALAVASLPLESVIRAMTWGLFEAAAAPSTAVGSGNPLIPTALGVLAAALLAAGIVWWRTGTLARAGRAPALAAGTATTVLLSVSLAPTWAISMVGVSTAAIGAATLLALFPARPTDDGAARSARITLAIVAVGAALIASALGFAVDGAWVLGVAVAVMTVSVGVAATSSHLARGIAYAVASLLIVATGPVLAGDLAPLIGVTAPAAVTLALCGLLIGASGLVTVRLSDARALLATTLPVAILAAALVMDAADPAVAVAASVAALLIVLGLSVRLHRRDTAADAWLIGALLPGAVVILADRSTAAIALSADLIMSGEDRALVAVAAATVTAVVALGTTAGRTRASIDAGAGAIIAVALAVAAATGPSSIILLVAGVATLTVSISRDGLLSSRSARRYVGWVALALGIAALWRLLTEQAVTELEWYVLPISAALLSVAALLSRVPAERALLGPLSGPALLVASALGISALPLAAASGDAHPLRGVIVGVIATLIVLGVLIGRVRSDGRWGGRAPGLLVVGVLAQVLLAGSATWAVLTAARDGMPVPLLQLVGIVTVIMLVGTAAAAWASAPRTAGRVRSRSHGATTALTAGGAAIVALLLGVGGAVEAVELLALPLALGLLVIGTLELELRNAARSLGWLTPGLTALLVPSFVAVSIDPELWRVVAVGLGATAVFIGGVARRLQAPFVVGGAIVMIHLLVQTWPLLEQVGRAVEWWLWLGIAGVIVVAVAARYEQRVQNLTTAVRHIAQLR
ncbi:hypothetical protein EV140_2458 [Microcella alkaliphila]|uniref:DUF2157 domain-containing protein n=1 Tax=Microcella alkaliphila TaxID=279828 RepID=A0A4Q7TCT3_9MICO|nr:hypothetical protein [Microcella alkaliphila]RZT58215.1 hypothetical protein EV140_2458 [Microcella alkaliphila]